MQAQNATLLSSKRKLSLVCQLGASTSSHDQQTGPLSKRTRTEDPARGGKTYSLQGPAPSANFPAADAFPFMFTSKKSPNHTSIPLRILNPSTRIHPSLCKTEDIPGPSPVLPPSVDSNVDTSSSYNHSTILASSRTLLKDIWNGLRSFYSNFDPKKHIFVLSLLGNAAMRNAFTFHTLLLNVFCASSASEAVTSESSDRSDAGIQAKPPSLEPTLLDYGNGSSPSFSLSVPTTPTRTLYRRIHNEVDSTQGLAASTPKCVNAASVSSETGTGDEGKNSHVEANVRYLQAEIECLIQHEVKTEGMQTHFRNLLNALAPNLCDILRGIYTYVGSVHCNDYLPHTRLDDLDLRHSTRVLVGDHVSLEIGSVSHEMVDPIAVSIRVKNSSCQVDIQAKN